MMSNYPLKYMYKWKSLEGNKTKSLEGNKIKGLYLGSGDSIFFLILFVLFNFLPISMYWFRNRIIFLYKKIYKKLNYYVTVYVVE